MPITKEQFEGYGLKLFKSPTTGTYWYGSNRGIGSVSSAFAQELINAGVQSNAIRPDLNTEQLSRMFPGINFNTSGLGTLNSYNDVYGRYGAQEANRLAQQQQEQEATSLNQAIASGDLATVQRLRPGYTLSDGNLIRQDVLAQQQALATDSNQVNIGTSEQPLYVPKDGQSGDGTGGGGTSGSYDTGVPEIDGIINRLYKMIEDNLSQGQQINPNIELDPSVIQGFLDQASSEIEPYYSSQINLMKDDLGKNLEYLSKQYTLGKEESEAKFKETLAGSREQRAGTGTVFSGGRGRQEQAFGESQSRNLEQSALETQRQAQGQYSQAERTIGSRNLSGITTPSFESFSASPEGAGSFTPGRNLSFTGTGDVVGSLERERLTSERSRANELEFAERQRRG